MRQVAFTHHSTAAPSFTGDVRPFWVCASFVYLPTSQTSTPAGFLLGTSSSHKSLEGGFCEVQVNLVNGEGLQQCINELTPLAAIINTAAMSSPGTCEKDSDTAR